MVESNDKKRKGGITLIPLVIAGFTLLASIGGAWISASASAQREISTVNTKVELVERTEELHYKELKEDLDEIKDDIKQLLKNSLTNK